MLSCRS